MECVAVWVVCSARSVFGVPTHSHRAHVPPLRFVALRGSSMNQLCWACPLPLRAKCQRFPCVQRHRRKHLLRILRSLKAVVCSGRGFGAHSFPFVACCLVFVPSSLCTIIVVAANNITLSTLELITSPHIAPSPLHDAWTKNMQYQGAH